MPQFCSLLANPEVLRQLQTLQQTMANAQQQEMDMDKMRKLQEMKQQEEEFDKHLAQTVPVSYKLSCSFIFFIQYFISRTYHLRLNANLNLITIPR